MPQANPKIIYVAETRLRSVNSTTSSPADQFAGGLYFQVTPLRSVFADETCAGVVLATPAQLTKFVTLIKWLSASPRSSRHYE